MHEKGPRKKEILARNKERIVAGPRKSHKNIIHVERKRAETQRERERGTERERGKSKPKNSTKSI